MNWKTSGPSCLKGWYHYPVNNSIGFGSSYPVASTIQPLNSWGLCPVSRKSRKLFGSENPFVKLRPPNSVKLVFSYLVKGLKIETNNKVSCLENPSFWRYKENYRSAEKHLKTLNSGLSRNTCQILKNRYCTKFLQVSRANYWNYELN